MSNFQQWIEKSRDEFEKYLNGLFIFDDNVPLKLQKSIKYAVFSGGKRIRPLLIFASGEYFNISHSKLYPLAAGVELIHTYSLIHDDLPALDNDDLRRGKPTVHKQFDEATAILTGDALLTHSFFVISQLTEFFSPDRVVDVIRYVSLAAGINGMVAGQQIDIEGEGVKLGFNDVKKMAFLKTGRLIQASIFTPLLLSGNASKDWENIAGIIGLLFQVVDDLLDVMGDEKKVGKKLRKDEMRGKNTFVTAMGLKGAMEFRDKLKTEILQFLPAGINLTNLVKFIAERDY